MSGAAIVRYQLVQDAPLLAEVPAERILTGVIPERTALPAISVVTVDAFPRTPVDMTETRLYITERVQVVVYAKDYASKKTILGLVRDALPLSRGTVNNFKCDCILPDSIGPDLDDPEEAIFTQSRDYMVRWSEA